MNWQRTSHYFRKDCLMLLPKPSLQQSSTKKFYNITTNSHALCEQSLKDNRNMVQMTEWPPNFLFPTKHNQKNEILENVHIHISNNRVLPLKGSIPLFLSKRHHNQAYLSILFYVSHTWPTVSSTSNIIYYVSLVELYDAGLLVHYREWPHHYPLVVWVGRSETPTTKGFVHIPKISGQW